MDTLEQDYHNFSSSSSHRLPTLSGTEAIRNAISNAHPIPTSLPLLDETLSDTSVFKLSSSAGGIQRGLVTEVFGPPGVGKTTFALQVAVNAIQSTSNRTKVTWIDTSTQLLQSRQRQLIEAYRLPPGHDPPSLPPLPRDDQASDSFNYMQIRSLPKLLTLFLHSSNTFPPPNTGLIVLDDLSNLILSSLPNSTRTIAPRGSKKPPASIQDAALTKRILSRRFQVLSSFASALQKFAASRNVAILVTSKAAVNLRAGQKAALRPALSSQQWDNYLSARIALFRDFWPDETSTTQLSDNVDMEGPTDSEKRTVRFAKVVRLGGKLVSSSEVGFVIEEGGLRQVAGILSKRESSVMSLATQPLHLLEDVLDTDANENEGPTDGNEMPTESDVAGAIEALSQETPGKTKRKAIEITDSDNEDNQSEHNSEDEQSESIPVTASQENGFKPSSQVYHQGLQTESEAALVTAKKIRADTLTPQGKSNEDEMLLELYDKTFAPLSQAGVEMSDPLTPSDDGRDIS